MQENYAQERQSESELLLLVEFGSKISLLV